MFMHFTDAKMKLLQASVPAERGPARDEADRNLLAYYGELYHAGFSPSLLHLTLLHCFNCLIIVALSVEGTTASWGTNVELKVYIYIAL